MEHSKVRRREVRRPNRGSEFTLVDASRHSTVSNRFGGGAAFIEPFFEDQARARVGACDRHGSSVARCPTVVFIYGHIIYVVHFV